MRKTSKEQYDKPCANVQNIWTGYPGPTAGTERFSEISSRLVSCRTLQEGEEVVVPTVPSYKSVPTQQRHQRLNSWLCGGVLLFRGESCYRVMGGELRSFFTSSSVSGAAI